MPSFDDFETDEEPTVVLPGGWEEKTLEEKVKLLKNKLVERVYTELNDTSMPLDPALGNLARGIIKDLDVSTVSELGDPGLAELINNLPHITGKKNK